MSRIRIITRLVMVVSVIIAALSAHSVTAQRPGTTTSGDDGTYESEVTNLEFTWTDDWELASTDVSEDEEILELESEYGTLYSGFGLYPDAEAALDDVVSGFEESLGEVEFLDEVASRGLAWTLFTGVSDTDDPYVVYVEAQEDVVDDWEFLTVVVATEDAFVDQYELVRQTVEMDGDALLGELDSEEIEAMLTGDVAAEDEASTPATGGRNESETGRVDDDESSNAEGDSYVFESEDIEVVVNQDIQISDIQLEEDSYEQVLLVGVGSIGAVSIVQSPADAENTLENFMQGFMEEMDDFRELETGTDGSVAWGLYETRISGMDMYVYASVNDDLFGGHFLQLIAAPVDGFEDEFLLYQDAVQINGASMFEDIAVETLLDIIDAS